MRRSLWRKVVWDDFSISTTPECLPQIHTDLRSNGNVVTMDAFGEGNGQNLLFVQS